MASIGVVLSRNRLVTAAPLNRARVLLRRWSSIDFSVVPTVLHPCIKESSQVFSMLCTVLCTVKTLCNHVLMYGCSLDDLFLNRVIILNAVKVS